MSMKKNRSELQSEVSEPLDNLQRQGYPCFLPLVPVESVRRGRLAVVEQALMSDTKASDSSPRLNPLKRADV